MKRNLLPLFAGIAALGLSLGTVPFALSQSNPGNNPAKPDKFSRLNLTPDQQTRIDALRAAERQQILVILTRRRGDSTVAILNGIGIAIAHPVVVKTPEEVVKILSFFG